MTGGRASLYGSDFQHNATIRLRIARSELHRSLYHDRPHARGQLIEIDMSEAQWATLISSPNVGDGTQCTIRYIGGEIIPALPDPEARTKQSAEEFKEASKRTVGRIKTVQERIDSMNLPKGKTAEIKDALDMVIQDLTANYPFLAKSFAEYTEEVVEKAKQEIHGYMQNVINRAGITALQSGPLPLQIEASNDDDG
ncbi:hypothetical protein KEU06_08975 [Pseudaminobacter sp. 19-2017]|uniref:Uncharacterized protein n=1 Tax=Pseudaminobacter soli (ex Zhang et al. 2022) TaxID=2831468 RepID=A0A942E0S2_9HYPH|nr:hypothetical protein [Pseudaminobacter soli]MBS3648760.1 hypothetical protein [Pseudaminobacter soli]